jgi:hypothetical protein
MGFILVYLSPVSIIECRMGHGHNREALRLSAETAGHDLSELYQSLISLMHMEWGSKYSSIEFITDCMDE